MCQLFGEEGRLVRGKMLSKLGFRLAIGAGDLQKGLAMLGEAEALLRTMAEKGKWPLATCLWNTSWVQIQLGDIKGALDCARECSIISHEIGSFWADINDVPLGDVLYKLGDYEKAESIFKRAILAQHELGDPWNLDHWLRKLGDVYRAQHKFGQANAAFKDH